jgi:hypothetical protein
MPSVTPSTSSVIPQSQARGAQDANKQQARPRPKLKNGEKGSSGMSCKATKPLGTTTKVPGVVTSDTGTCEIIMKTILLASIIPRRAVPRQGIQTCLDLMTRREVAGENKIISMTRVYANSVG